MSFIIQAEKTIAANEIVSRHRRAVLNLDSAIADFNYIRDFWNNIVGNKDYDDSDITAINKIKDDIYAHGKLLFA